MEGLAKRPLKLTGIAKHMNSHDVAEDNQTL